MRTGADARLRRLLAMIPWVAAQEGPTVEEVCQRFGIKESELTADLELLFLCGLHPFSPDMLIEADLADGRVWIRYADYFARPLRLTAAEGLSLVAAGAALLAVPGTDSEGPLARGLAKLAGSLGVAADEAVEVALAPAEPELLEALQSASAGHFSVEIDYYAYGRDERTRRVIDPWSVFSTAGQWYVLGYCHRAEGERLFRLDRIHEAVVLDQTFTPPPRPLATANYNPQGDDPLVVLDLTPVAHWVADQFPNEGVARLDGNILRVTLRASEKAWLERLLLQLGPDATVVQGGEGVARAAARRVLHRYGVQPPVTSASP